MQRRDFFRTLAAVAALPLLAAESDPANIKLCHRVDAKTIT